MGWILVFAAIVGVYYFAKYFIKNSLTENQQPTYKVIEPEVIETVNITPSELEPKFSPESLKKIDKIVDDEIDKSKRWVEGVEESGTEDELLKSRIMIESEIFGLFYRAKANKRDDEALGALNSLLESKRQIYVLTKDPVKKAEYRTIFLFWADYIATGYLPYTFLKPKIIEFLKTNPGFIQSEIYPHFNTTKDSMRNILYVMDLLGVISREKKGRSYALNAN